MIWCHLIKKQIHFFKSLYPLNKIKVVLLNFKNLIHIVKTLQTTFTLSNIEKRLYTYFKESNTRVTNSKIVLIQCVEDYAYFGLFGEIAKLLKENQKFRIEQYTFGVLEVGTTNRIRSFLFSLLHNSRFRHNKWIKLYSSYSDGIAYRHDSYTNILFDLDLLYKAYKIYKELKSKKDVLALKISDIYVGDLIYDTYLRFKPSLTVHVPDFYLCFVIWKALKLIKITKKYFETKKPIVLLTSYSTYIQHGIAVRVALSFNTKVYSFGNYQNLAKLLTKNDYFNTKDFHNYKTDFEKLENQEKLLTQSRQSLENRLKGDIDLATFYMKQSAYQETGIEIPDVKNCVIVFLHDFYDSPHVYGNLVFPDFWEWIQFTIQILETNSIPYYLKPHPSQKIESEHAVEFLKKTSPNVKFLSPKITNKQLANAGIKLGISMYGTVAHELVYLGVPVILCAENPHSSYDFCFEAKTLEEYKSFIQNYKSLSIPKNAKEQVESFYYMHNLNNTQNELELLNDFLLFVKYCYIDKKSLSTEEYINKLQKVSKNQEFTKFVATIPLYQKDEMN